LKIVFRHILFFCI